MEPEPVKKKRSKGKSPTARSLELLRERGYRCEVVERRIPHSFITKDLFGFIDIIAIKGGETLAVQTTSGDNVSHRAEKIAESETVGDVREAGWRIHIHGWRKGGKQGERKTWTCREVDVS
jgi:hypothetical protein